VLALSDKLVVQMDDPLEKHRQKRARHKKIEEKDRCPRKKRPHAHTSLPLSVIVTDNRHDIAFL
jgi:hypothetical protein